jgi:integrase
MSDSVKSVKRRGRKVLVIDFTYVDAYGRRQRYRRDAQAATVTGARDEARRLMDRAARTGCPFLADGASAKTVASFVADTYRTHFLPSTRPGTQERYTSILELHVLPFFGDTALDEIDAMALRRFETYLRDRQITSVRHYASVVRAVLRAAVQAGELAEMPQNLPAYPQSKKIPECPTAEDVRLLLEHAGESWLRAAVALMAYAGLRVSEARALEIRDIDLERDVLYVRRNFSGDKNGGVKLDSTKDSEHRHGADQRPAPTAPGRSGAAQASHGAAPADGGRQRAQEAARRRPAEARPAAQRPARSRAAPAPALLHDGAATHPEAVRQLTGHGDLKTLARYAHATRQDVVDAVGKLE